VRPREEIDFGYRTCGLDDPVIIAATIRLEHDDPVRIRDEVKAIFAYKKTTQPLADHSAGCTFRNAWDPAGETHVPAGRLIDEAGLKGLRIGGAEVSRQHANFIVTHPGATARDVQRLMTEVSERVFAHTGLRLRPELVVWDRAGDGGDAGAGTDAASPDDGPAAPRRGVLDLDPPEDAGGGAGRPGAGP